MSASKGSNIGSAVGMVLGPVGSVVGGLIGGIIGGKSVEKVPLDQAVSTQQLSTWNKGMYEHEKLKSEIQQRELDRQKAVYEEAASTKLRLDQEAYQAEIAKAEEESRLVLQAQREAEHRRVLRAQEQTPVGTYQHVDLSSALVPVMTNLAVTRPASSGPSYYPVVMKSGSQPVQPQSSAGVSPNNRIAIVVGVILVASIIFTARKS